MHPIRIIILAMTGGITMSWATVSAQDAARSQNVHRPLRVATSFEEFQPGEFRAIEGDSGSWTVTEGSAIIDKAHSVTGSKCLQLAGGAKSVVQWRPSETIVHRSTLRFKCERWTARPPFSFKVEGETKTGWKELYDGTEDVRVGRSFLSDVSIPVGNEPTFQFRFTVTSPQNTGVLIDDLVLAPSTPQQITSIEATPLIHPVLIGAAASPVIAIDITTEGDLNPLAIEGIHMSWDTSAAQNLQEMNFSVAGRALQFTTIVPSGTQHLFQLPKGDFTLSDGSNRIVIACKPSANANPLEFLQLGCTSLTLSNGETRRVSHDRPKIRIGTALRSAKEDGVDTYRIPGLATTNSGSLIAVYDVRYRGGADLPADIDIGMSRSTNGGITWEPMRIILDMGSDPRWSYDGVGDPAILVDRETGTIWVAGLWSHGNRGWHGSAQGINPDVTGQLMLVRSDDDGATWSDPINITSQVKDPDWCLLLQGPGKGISMSDGTLVFAAQFQDKPQNARLPNSTILYSKDHGTSWAIGTGAFPDTTEAQVIELEPGVLMLNCRYNRDNSRVVMTTSDMGETWQEHSSSRGKLIEPRACMASLIRRDERAYSTDNTWVFFSNPNSLTRREKLTIKASNDMGNTWHEANQLLLDQGTSAGYSCLTMIDDATLGILYEGSQSHLTFQRIPIDAVINEDE